MALDSPAAVPSLEAVVSTQRCYDEVQREFPEAVRDFEKKWAVFRQA